MQYLGDGAGKDDGGGGGGRGKIRRAGGRRKDGSTGGGFGTGGEVSGKLRGTIGLTKGDKKQGKINEESN